MKNITYSREYVQPGKYFPALTGLRAVAALLVFFYHDINGRLQSSSVIIDEQHLINKMLYLMMHQGQIGVTIFFVLSGFLITVRYADSSSISSFRFKEYLQNRFARIYPIYFILTVLTFMVMLLHPLHEWYEWPATVNIKYKIVGIFANLTLMRAYVPDLVFLGLPTAWTLTVEETFYVCAPYLILRAKKSFSGIYISYLAIIVVGILLVIICMHLPFVEAKKFDIEFMMSSTFFGRCIEFLVGVSLGVQLKKGVDLKLGGRITLAGGAGIFIVVLILASIEQLMGDASGPPLSVYIFLNNFVLPFPIALLLYGLATETSALQKLLSSKLFNILGKSSYVFYLIHIGIIDSLFIIYFTNNWIMRLVFHTILSVVIYKTLENPLQKLFRAKTMHPIQ